METNSAFNKWWDLYGFLVTLRFGDDGNVRFSAGGHSFEVVPSFGDAWLWLRHPASGLSLKFQLGRGFHGSVNGGDHFSLVHLHDLMRSLFPANNSKALPPHWRNQCVSMGVQPNKLKIYGH